VYRRLSDAGLAPEIIRTTTTHLTTKTHTTLTEWLHGQTAEHEMKLMGQRLVDRITELHTLGVCHRDLHDGNVVLTDELVPLFIDPAFAIACDPRAPCYDLIGPDSSGVPVAPAHASQTDHRYGV
jgi:tRNA A-37 threonylcarbamoyl transferase component Bud32